MKNINISRAIIPNALTALNAVSGFLSIIYASQSEFRLSAMFIIAAAFFDLLDGIVARLLNTSSEFGVELDSLSDIISFGAAPAFLIYTGYLYQYNGMGIALGSLLLICGAFRLARFNVQVDDLKNKKDFKGLPIPISAVTIATLVITFHEDGSFATPYTYFVIPLIFLLSILMVSRIKYDSFPKINRSTIKGRILVLIFLVLAIILVFITDGSALFFIFISYVLIGIFRWIFYLIFSHKQNEEVNIKEETN